MKAAEYLRVKGALAERQASSNRPISVDRFKAEKLRKRLNKYSPALPDSLPDLQPDAVRFLEVYEAVQRVLDDWHCIGRTDLDSVDEINESMADLEALPNRIRNVLLK